MSNTILSKPGRYDYRLYLKGVGRKSPPPPTALRSSLAEREAFELQTKALFEMECG